MPRKKDPNSCDCIDKAQKALEPKGVALSVGLTLSGHVFPKLQIKSLKSQRATNALIVTCTFCPFCGVRLKYPAKAAS